MLCKHDNTGHGAPSTDILFTRRCYVSLSCSRQLLLLTGKLEGIASLWKRLIGGNQEASSRSCNIKGNISKRGRIMFLPTDKGYDSVKIDTEVGEKWFCNVAEAKKAGWRQTKV